MDEECSKHRRDDKCIQDFGRKALKGRNNLKSLGADRRIILKYV
jgi:hypothetical protein